MSNPQDCSLPTVDKVVCLQSYLGQLCHMTYKKILIDSMYANFKKNFKKYFFTKVSKLKLN